MLERILDIFPDEEFLVADGFEGALIGVDLAGMRLIYSQRIALEILSEEMELDEAREYFVFNILGAHLGEKTPIWLLDFPE